MTFAIEKRPDDILLKGELDMSAEHELTRSLDPEPQNGGDLVLDLSELTFIDSSGVRVLLRTADRLADRGRVILRTPSPAVARVFDLMRLETVPNIEVQKE
ncbi:MAG TPA: STAS domain-containing protein [Actinomycetota bacterium]|jgi:anti-anti-sigma factor